MESPCSPGSGRLHITPMEEDDLQTPLLPLRSPPIHPQQNGSPTPGIQMQCGETECRTIRWKQRGAICTNYSEGAVSEDKTQAYGRFGVCGR